MNATNLPYRPCVGIALFNEDGKVFMGERHDTPGAWQMPQGGVDEGEDIQTAAFRELHEETGIQTAILLEIMPQTVTYDSPPELLEKLAIHWGRPYRGQEQTWVAMRFTGKDEDINLNAHDHAEFSQWQWVDLSKSVQLIVPFKRDVYDAVIEAFSKFAT